MKFYTPIPLSKLLHVIQSIPYQILGDSEIFLSGMDDYRIVLPGEITWVDYAPYYHEALASCATAIIIDSIPHDIPQDKVLIVVDEPKSVFSKIAENFYRMQFPTRTLWDRIFNPKNIHRGKKCRIHPTVSIGRDVYIGDNVTIEAHVTIHDNVYIGNDTTIRAGSVIGTNPFAYTQCQSTGKWEPRKAFGNVVIMDNVDILALNTIERGITGSTIIGSGTKTGCHVLISHDVWIGNNCYLCGEVSIGGYARVKNNCTFWGRAAIANSVTIAHHTTIQSNGVVHQSITKPGLTLAGVPAQEADKYWHSRAIMNVLVKDYERSGK